MLTGWALHKDRYAKYLTDPPLVVFICRDQADAKELCRAADPVVTAAHGYGGEYAAEWPYPARARMFFVAERDVHEGRLVGYALPTHPPDVRVGQVDGDAKRAPAAHAATQSSRDGQPDKRGIAASSQRPRALSVRGASMDPRQANDMAPDGNGLVRVASISSSNRQLTPRSSDVSACQRNDVAVMSVKRQRSCGSSSSLISTISPPTGRPMKRRTRPLTGSIQVDRQASMAGS
jgi:hypothetical protein